MAITIGDMAPDFSLVDSDMKMGSLADYRGRNVVILFFPLAFTSVCTAELCGVRDDLITYNQLQAEVLAISVDTLFTLKKFKEEQGLNFRMLSDFNKTTSRAYGALYEDYFGMQGVSKRAAFVVDKEGRIAYAEVHDKDDVLPDFEAIKAVLGRLS
ncbi:MAG: redoxin domain-containing protein [Chitinophagaceae bacterium]|nr:redoxin domain-containing protein [Chitinophagaceae bacterium]